MKNNLKGVPLGAQTVGVMGSGEKEHKELAKGLGELLASLEVNLLTGGGGGVMKSVSRAFTEVPHRTRGICIGIIPCRSEEDRKTPRKGYPNEFVELAIYTHLPFSGPFGTHDLSRNHINVLSCAAIVALPGGEGTKTEVSLALDYGKPLIAYARDLSQVSSFPEAVARANDLEEVKRFLRTHLEQAR